MKPGTAANEIDTLASSSRRFRGGSLASRLQRPCRATGGAGALRIGSAAPRPSSSAVFSAAVPAPSSSYSSKPLPLNPPLPPFSSFITRVLTYAFVASMCVALPVSLNLLRLVSFVLRWDKGKEESLSLRVGCFCARWCMRIFPFAKFRVIGKDKVVAGGEKSNEQPPTIWVCNHISMLDIFFMLAGNKKLRGGKCQPIKIIYWRGLESNPVTKILFKSCGFIPVDMEANAAGEDNQYDPKTFRTVVKGVKAALKSGFDVGILPEGQLNPTPSKGLLPVFSGAQTIARMAKADIEMMAIHGTDELWHATDGIVGRRRDVMLRRFGRGRKYESKEEFLTVFEKVVGEFGKGRTYEEEELDAIMQG